MDKTENTNIEQNSMIDGAFWDSDRFDKTEYLNKDGSVPDYFKKYRAKVDSVRGGRIQIWARSEEEAMLIADDLTEAEIEAYIPCTHVGQRVEIEETTEPLKKERIVILALKDQDGLDVKTVLIDLRTALPEDEIIPAVKAACQDYLNTPEGKKQWEDNCHCFNYGDFDMYVGNEFCKPHGFVKVDSESFDVIDDDFNTALGEPDENPDSTGFMLDEPYNRIKVTGENIDDTMESAMSGCTYWCERAEPVNGYLGQYASEQISRGGEILFIPYEDEPVTLDKEKFRKGLNMWLSEQTLETIDRVLGISRTYYDPGQVDAADADSILQYALFGELVYA